MGRGLSDIQKQILGLAFNAYRDGEQYGVVSSTQLMLLVGKVGADTSLRTYNKLKASFSRSVRRLEQRGLIERRYGGGNGAALTLTDQGTEHVKRLTGWVGGNP